MFWPGLLALEVTTSTPDALCPPLEEARAAIAARVGEVQGGYRVEFSLVRLADGKQALELVVLHDEQPVLERQLPLDATGCEDAAQTIALVLERYFDAIEPPNSTSVAPKLEPVPEVTRPQMSQMSTAAMRPRDVGPTRGRHGASALRVSLGLIDARELGWAPTLSLELRPTWAQLGRRWRLGWAAALSPFVSKRTETVRDQLVAEKTLQLASSLPLELELQRWSSWLGPWAQLRVQRAEGAGLEHDQPGYRGLFGIGVGAGLGWSPSAAIPALTLTLGGAIGAQLSEASARFVLRDADGSKKPVLVPETIFAQAGLALSLAL